MSLRPHYGHDELRARLTASVAAQRLPQSILLTGPEGCGKQHLGLWLGRLLLCEAALEDGPCERCRSCRLAGDLQHPDLHWFVPLPAPKGSHTPRKRREKLEDARLAFLAAKREHPLALSDTDRAAALYLPIVDEIRARAARRPAMAHGAVFLIGDAERMVPQASSPEAANAFLKLLEEPPEDTLFVLTSSRPGLLLPTIRSRVLAVRVHPVDEPTVARFLVSEAGLDRREAEVVARRSAGRIGLALRKLDEEADLRPIAVRLVRAALSRSPADRWIEAAALSPTGARGAFSDLLDALETVLRDCVTIATGAPGVVARAELDAELPGLGAIATERWISAVSCVDRARDAALGNGNPQAITADLLACMARELRPSGSGVPERHAGARVGGAS